MSSAGRYEYKDEDNSPKTLNDKQTALSKIWTQIANSISYDDNRFSTLTQI